MNTLDEGVFENGIYRAHGTRIMDRSGDRRLPIGDDGFERICSRSVFVDKSLFIADVLGGNNTVTLFCRPRRFGKTLAMTMLRAFLELPTDGVDRAPLFKGLAIWDADNGRYRCEQGVRPVIYFSYNDVKKYDWASASAALAEKIAAEYRRHRYLLETGTLDESERRTFESIINQQATQTDLEASLRQLALYLKRHHGRGTVILIDEYDAPIMAGHANGYYREITGFMKGWLTGAFKDGGESLDFACLTGVQRISKESIFSDLNNLVVDTPLDIDSEERFGFTGDDVAALASYLGRSTNLDEVKLWYDGYRFGSSDIYNPWSVLNYFGKGCRPGVYWTNTASNAVVGEAIRSSDPDTLDSIFALMQPGGVVWRPLDMGVVFPESGLTGDALWSMLYLAGYLTTDDVDDPTDQYRLRPLRLPNLEITRVFRGEVIDRSRDVAGGTQRLSALHDALITCDAAGAEAELARILMESPSCRDLVSENSYHMLLAGLLFGMPGYGDPLCNREAGKGYYDIRLSPEPYAGMLAHTERPSITIELKVLGAAHAPTESEARATALRHLSQKGLDQIDAKGYDTASAEPRIRYGIAFCGKDVAVTAVALPLGDAE